MFFAFDASCCLLFSFPLLASAQLCPWWVEVPCRCVKMHSHAPLRERKKPRFSSQCLIVWPSKCSQCVRDGYRRWGMGGRDITGVDVGGGWRGGGDVGTQKMCRFEERGSVWWFGGGFEVGMEGILTLQTWVTSSSQPLLVPRQTLACCPVARTCRPAPRNCPSSGGSWCLCVAQGGSSSNDGGRG